MKKKILAGALAVVLLLSLCACGAGKGADKGLREESFNGGYYLDEYEGEALYAAAEAADFDMGGGLAASYSRAAAPAENAALSAKSTSESESPEDDPEKIIYSADVTAETTAFEESLRQLDTLVERFGGWIEASSVNGANYYDLSRGRSSTRSASYTLRIPSGRFEELLGSLSELGNIPYTHLYTENVTAQYYDVQARLTAYETQEARLLELMETAESVEDVIAIEARLSELRYQIESLQTTLRGWDRRVSYSTVYLQLNEVKEYTPENPVRITFGERLSRAFRSGAASLAEFFESALLWLVEALPALGLLAVLAAAAVPLVRKSRRKRNEKKAAKAAKD